MTGLERYLADVAAMRGFVPAEEMHPDQYDAAESRGMDNPYGYSEEADWRVQIVHVA